MSIETNLREAMAAAVAPTHPDTDELVSVSRRRGLGIRRRRQALGSVGVAAALGLAVLAPSLVAGDRGSNGDAAGSVTVGSAQRTFDPSRTTTITGRSNAAALMYAVGLEADGTATDFRGQAYTEDIVQTYAGFAFTPTGSSTAGEVGVNVQFVPPGSQAKGDKDSDAAFRCREYMERCEITRLADGSDLRTYQQHSDYGSHTGLRLVADLDRTDHVRVVAFASNGYDVSERDERITRTEPVLTTTQLVAVVTQPWWGTQLPTYFAEQGDQLKPYNPIEGAAASASPTPAPGNQ